MIKMSNNFKKKEENLGQIEHRSHIVCDNDNDDDDDDDDDDDVDNDDDDTPRDYRDII